MNVLTTELPGVLIIEPVVHRDDRGFFCESFNAARYREAGLPTNFVQDNRSRSSIGVLRGLHYQRREPQGKLVSCVQGEIFDVAVDVRRGSPTFGRWTGVLLCGDAPRALWVPPGFAHGFCTLSPIAEVVYKCTALYRADDDRGVLWSDPAIDIRWPIERPRLSAKDERLPPLSAASADLPAWLP